MLKWFRNFVYFAGEVGQLLLPVLCFGLVIAAKTQLFSNTIGMANSSKQTVSQFMGTGGALVVILSISLLLGSRLRVLYLIIADVLLSVGILSDLMLFRHFQDVMTIKTFATAWYYITIETAWWKLLRFADVLLGVDFFLLGGWWIYKRSTNSAHSFNFKVKSLNGRFKPNWSIKFVGFSLVFLLGLGGCARAYNFLELDQPGITRTFYSKVYITQSLGEWEFRALDFYRNLKTRLLGETIQLSKPQREVALANWLRAEHPTALKAESVSKVKEGTNLIVVQIESLQEFVIGKSINGQEITPNLNRLIKGSLYFNHYFGETWSGGTADAEFMSNVSLYPVSVGNAYMDYPKNNFISLGKVLGGKGYRTVAMEADQPGFWDMDLMLRAEGFQHILDEDDFDHDLDIGMGLADHSMFQQGAAYLEKMPQPFYSFLVTLSSHYPFLIPDKYKTINVEPYKEKEFGHYLEAVHYTDQALGYFLERLQADGLLDKSMLAIYGDHQAPLTRDNLELRKFLGYGEGNIDDYQWFAMQKVPLLIHLPNDSQKGVKEIVGGHVDLFPTILGLFGEDTARFPLLGHDLLNSSTTGLAISRSGLLVSGDALFDMNNQKVYQLKSGKPLPWDNYSQKRKRYYEYLKNTDSIMKYDLQKNLHLILSQESSP